MENHIYAKPGKFKNVNCGYALVNNIVFGSIFAAEKYCMREGLDPNIWIRADDQETLAECKRIAYAALPIIRELKTVFFLQWDSMREDTEKCVVEREKAKNACELGWEAYSDRAMLAAGKCSGFYECAVQLFDYIATLERIMRI